MRGSAPCPDLETGNTKLETLNPQPNPCAHSRLACYDSRNIAGVPHIKHHDRKIVVHASRYRRSIHNFQLTFQHLLISYRIVTNGRRVLHRIGVIYAFDFCRFKNYVGFDFKGAQRGGGVGCEIWIAGTGGKDNDATLLEVANGAPPDEWLGQLWDVNRRHHARLYL